MIDYEKIRVAITKGLKAYTNRPIIRQNQDKEPPAYPYLSYTITTLVSQNKGTYGEYEDGKHRKPVNQIWSVSAQSSDDSECAVLAAQAREWLDHVGTTYLSDNGIIVESVGGVTNRDNLLTIGYEYKKGFDVTFSLFDSVENPTSETIDSVFVDIEKHGGE